MAKKKMFELSKTEFREMLFRHAEQDAAKWVPEMKVLLSPDDAAFIEELRKANAVTRPAD